MPQTPSASPTTISVPDAVDADPDEGLRALSEVTGLDWRWLAEDDLPGVSGLLTAIELLDEPTERHSLEELQEAWAGGAMADGDAVVGRLPGGEIIAYAWNFPDPAPVDAERRRYLTGGVHPGFRQQGIGRAVLDWQISRAARSGDSTQLVCFVDDHLSDQRELLTLADFRPVRWSSDMVLSFADTPVQPEPDLPSGIEILRYEPSLAEAVRDCHNACFAEHPMSKPVGSEAWHASLAREAARPEWSWVARDTATGMVVGYALNSDDSGNDPEPVAEDEDPPTREGWTDRLGVLPSRRGHGIAAALLLRSMADFRTAGLDGAGLGVDFFDATSGRSLYHRVGYHAARTSIMFVRSTPSAGR